MVGDRLELASGVFEFVGQPIDDRVEQAYQHGHRIAGQVGLDLGVLVRRTLEDLRPTLDLAGLAVFVEEVPEGTGAPPPAPYLGLEHLALVVDDLDAAVADLTAKGATLARPVSTPRPGVRICFVAAPDGSQVELLERT